MRLISSFCALACVSALPLAALAQTAAEPPAPETAPDTAGRTVLDVTASGTLTGLAADALGPDAALTVRLHGPVAFDVDTADFASLEIFADDPAVKLTVSDTAAYDRITAVSIPAASSGEPAAATFSAAAASAGIATLADTTTESTTPQNRVISVNFSGGRTGEWEPENGYSGTDLITDEANKFGYIPMLGTKWLNTDADVATLSKENAKSLSAYSFGDGSGTQGQGKLAYSSKNTYTVNKTDACDVILRGYLDDGSGITINVGGIPFEDYYDVYVYTMTDGSDKTFSSVQIGFPMEFCGTDSEFVDYSAGEGNQSAIQIESAYGSSSVRTVTLNQNVICIAGQQGKNLTIKARVPSGNSRSCIAAIQIVESFVKTIAAAEGAVGLGSLGLSGTATLEDGAVLTVDVQPNRLKVIGPETGTATLKIAADVDFSKIDLSEARNVTIELVSGCTTIPGGEWAVGDVTISTPVTLTVDGADVTPYWSVGGSLTIAEGSSLTVAVAEGVTITKPIQVISAGGTISGTISATAGLKVTQVGNVCWLTGSGTIRPENELSGSVNWSNIKNSLVDNSGASANLTEASSLVLTFAADASEGTTLTIDEALTLGSLAVNNQSANPVSIALGTGGSLTVANQVTVAAGTVGLPKDAVFATETRGVKPVLEIAGGATAVVDAANTTLVQRNAVRGLGEGAVLKVTDSVGYNLRNAGTDNVPILDNVRLEVPKITASHDGDPWLKDATVAFTGSESSSTWTAANWVKADGTVTVEVPEGRTVTFDTARAFRREGESKLVKTGAGTFAVKVQNIPIEVREGRLELTWWDSGRPTDGTTVAKGAILAMDAAGTLSFGTIAGEGTIEVTRSESGSDTVSTIGMAGEAFKGTLRVTEGVTKSGDWTTPCNVELNGTAGAGLTVGNGYTLSGTGTVTGTLTFENGATLDASVGALTVGGLTQPDTGTVTVKVAENAAVEDAVLQLSSGTADAIAAAQFTVAERDTLRVAASGSDYVLAPRMPTDGEASVTVTKPADGSPLNWSDLQWTVGSDTYPSAAAGVTNALTITIPAGTTVTVDELITAKSVNVVVTGDGIGTLSVEDRSYIMGIRERLLTDAYTLVTVPRKSTDAGLMDLSKVAGTGILEITDGMGDGTAKASGFGLTADFADGTLRIDTGVTVVDNPFAPVCNLDLLGTVEGNLTIAAGKSFGGTGTVKGMLSLSDNYILNCGTSPAQVPLIQGDTGTNRHFNTDHTPVNGRLWRDSGAANYVIRTATTPEDSDAVYVRQSSGYLVETFSEEGGVQGLRLPTAVELDLRSLQGDTGATSAILKWDAPSSWIIPDGAERLPGEGDTVRIMVPASRDVTLVIPPGMPSTISALDVIGMTGSAADWTIGTLRIVEGTVNDENGEVVPATSFTSTLTTSDLLLSGPMNIIHECNIIADKGSDPSAILPAAAIGSGAYGTVNIKAGTLQVKGYLELNNIALTVGGEEGSSAAKLACTLTISSTTPKEALSDGKWTGLKIMPSATLEFVGLKDLSPADTVDLAGGTLRAADGWGSVIYDEVLISAESKIDLGTNTNGGLGLSSYGVGSDEYVGFTGKVKVDIVGSGTLDVTQAQGDHGYDGYLNFVEGNKVTFNLGQRRPTINGKPYELDFTPTDTETEAGEVSVAVHDVDTFVIPETITVDGWEKAATALYDGKLRVTKVGYPVESDGSSIVPVAFSDATVQALREAAGSPAGNFTVNLKTVNGELLPSDAGAIDAAMTVFTNVAKKEETDGSVTVAYAFGISGITVNGNAVVVKAQVLGPEGAAAGYKDGIYVTLNRIDADDILTQVAVLQISSDVNQENGNVELTDGDALSGITGDGVLKFRVKATSGVEQDESESVPGGETGFE